MKSLTQKETQILALHEKILAYVTEECKKHPEYSAQDVYIAICYLKYRIAQCLSPEILKALDKSFIIDDGKSTKGSASTTLP